MQVIFIYYAKRKNMPFSHTFCSKDKAVNFWQNAQGFQKALFSTAVLYSQEKQMFLAKTLAYFSIW